MTHPSSQLSPNSPNHQASSPPLPNLHSLSISPYPHSPPNHGSQALNYGMNGVFAPMNGGLGWGGENKRGSRNLIPQGWYDQPSHSPTPPFESAYRHPSPALSPPTSSSSIPSAGSNMYNNYHQPPPYPDPYHPAMSAIGLANTPSPPPFIGMPSATPATSMSLHSIPPSMSSHNMPPFGSQSIPSLQRYRSPPFPTSPINDDDIIPTAIVIKNIPFSVPRESLLSIIESLGAPLPYAFNYHHDQGVFRGLAFANFRAAEEAQAVVAALNGYDVSGRKLRVEYKKVLQPGEKDRIEREKALKRMRSVTGFDKVNTNVVNGSSPNGDSVASPQIQSNPGHPAPINMPSRSINGHLAPQHEDYSGTSPPHSATSSSSENLPIHLDMNDPITLDIYSRCLLFKEDRMRDELTFSKNLSPIERRVVHLVAQKLGLTSSTRGEGEGRCVLVTKEAKPTLITSLSSNSGAGISSTYLSPYGSSLSDGDRLRIKKSMPDLRGSNGSSIPRGDPSRSLTSQRSSGNLRSIDLPSSSSTREYVSMGASAGRRLNGSTSNSGIGSSFQGIFNSPSSDIPPVPPIPASLTTRASFSFDLSKDENGNNTTVTRHPRGPAGESRGFGNGVIGDSAPNSSGTGGRVLRNSVSAVLRPTPSFGVGWGKVKEEESEDEIIETARTRESLEL